jgi:hypothetical protein
MLDRSTPKPWAREREGDEGETEEKGQPELLENARK